MHWTCAAFLLSIAAALLGGGLDYLVLGGSRFRFACRRQSHRDCRRIRKPIPQRGHLAPPGASHRAAGRARLTQAQRYVISLTLCAPGIGEGRLLTVQSKRGHPMKRRVLTAALITLVGVGGLSLSSLAQADSTNNPQADIQEGNRYCGADLPSFPVIGSTNFHREGNTVRINYHLKDARPNSTYMVSLWGNGCDFLGNVGTITTNKKGVANGNGSVTVPASSTRFFATSWGPDAAGVNNYHDTPAVTLTP